MARGRLRAKRRELAEVVPGLMRDHHRFVLRRHLDLIDELSRQIEKLDMRIAAVTDIPFGAALDLLQSIPGVGRRAAESMLAETGDDMSKFPSAGHFASWARVCPGNHESAGKRKSVSVGKGNAWLRGTLSQVAWAAVKTKGSYYGALYRRKKARGGPKKAIMAVQHALLVAIWHMFSRGQLPRRSGTGSLRAPRQATKSTLPGRADREDGCRGRGERRGCLNPERRALPTPRVSRKNVRVRALHRGGSGATGAGQRAGRRAGLMTRAPGPDRRSALIAPVDQLEEEDGAALGHRQVPDLVDDEERRVGQGLEAAFEPARGLGLLERVHQVGERSEVDLAPALGRGDREADGQMRLADPGRTRDVVLTNPVLSSSIGGTRCAVESWRSAGATSGAARAALSSCFLTGPGPRYLSG